MKLTSVYTFLTFIVILLCSPFFLKAQRIEGGRSAAMGNSSVNLVDIWAVYHNQGALAYLEKTTVGVLHQSGFIKEQNMQGVSFALPTKTGTIAASYSYFGFSQYNETQAGIAFGKAFSPYFSAGLQLNYLHTKIGGNYGKASTVNFEVGLMSRPLEDLFIGVHVYNPSRSKMGEEEIPVIFDLGTGYFFTEKFLLSIGTEKWINETAVFKAGIDYKLIKYVSLQLGVASNPARYSFGTGFYYNKLSIHAAFINHQTLGLKPSFTLCYEF